LPTPNNTPKQYHLLVTKGWMKPQAIRSDFNFRFSGFRVLEFLWVFIVLCFTALGFGMKKTLALCRNLSMSKDMRYFRGNLLGFATCFAGKSTIYK
jgi:hypothetical protein